MDSTILIMVGSFNPVTNAHIRLLEIAHAFVSKSNTVALTIISPTHERYPYKKIESNQHRLKMLQLAVSKSCIKIFIDTDECNHPDGFTPTCDVLRNIKKKHPSIRSMHLVYGADVLKAMCNVTVFPESNISDMRSLCKVLFFQRPQGCGAVDIQQILEQAQKIQHLQDVLNTSDFQLIPASVGVESSTEVRRGQFEMCCEEVREYILNNNLYNTITIDHEKCVGCGKCVDYCLRFCFESIENNIQWTDKGCQFCAECQAISPTNAIFYNQRNVSDLQPETKLQEVIMRRRSCRHYRQEEVPRDTIVEIIQKAKNSPSARGKRVVNFIVLGRKILNQLHEIVADALKVESPRKDSDLFHGCPHMLVAYTQGQYQYPEDGVIALTHIELLMNESQIGTCWQGILKLAAELQPSIKALFNLKEDDQIIECLGFGWTAVYPRLAVKNNYNISFVE